MPNERRGTGIVNITNTRGIRLLSILREGYSNLCGLVLFGSVFTGMVNANANTNGNVNAGVGNNDNCNVNPNGNFECIESEADDPGPSEPGGGGDVW